MHPSIKVPFEYNFKWETLLATTITSLLPKTSNLEALGLIQLYSGKF